MVITAAKISPISRTGLVIKRSAEFLVDPQDRLIKAAGVFPLLAALLSIGSTFASDDSINPKKAKPTGLQKFFADNFGLFSDTAFAGQAFQSLFAASPAKFLAYGPLTILNHLINVQARKQAEKIANQIRTLQESLETLKGEAKTAAENQIKILQAKLDEQKANLSLWMQSMIGTIGITFANNLALTPLKKSKEKTDIQAARTWPVFQKEILDSENRQANFSDWYGFYEYTPDSSLRSEKVRIELPQNNPLIRNWFRFAASATPTGLMGANINLRLVSLSAFIATAGFAGMNFIKNYFNASIDDKTLEAQNATANTIMNISSASSSAGVAVSALSNMALLNPLNIAKNGLAPCISWSTGGGLYGLSLATNLIPDSIISKESKTSLSDILKWVGTLVLFFANGALVLKRPLENYMLKRGLTSLHC